MDSPTLHAEMTTVEERRPGMQRASRAALARSRSIDQQLDEDRERREKEIQLLILGGASSGKSTFIKQMQLHLGDGYPEGERLRFKAAVYENLIEAIHVVLLYMKEASIASTAQTKQIYEDIADKYPKKNHYSSNNRPSSEHGPDNACSRPASRLCASYDAVPDYFPSLSKLLEDPTVKQCYKEEGACRLQLEKSDLYFLDHFERISHATFVPSIQDILYIRKPTLGVQEHLFIVDSMNYRVIDVAGQKNQRKKWIHFFDGVTAVMFFVSLSGYCEKLEEDKSLNSLHDSLHTFQEVAKNKYLEKTDFILFLNKKDVFEEKLKHKNLSEFFPSYEGENDVVSCSKYVKDEFTKRKPEDKHLYPHVSCAVDIEMMKKIITDVMQIVVEINLRRASTF